MKTARVAAFLSLSLLAGGVAVGAGVAAAPAATAAVPGFTAWPYVSWDACTYWQGQYAKKGYLVTGCVYSQSHNGYSFQYKRQLR
ncbi:hypothetical protein [Arthrobacter sp. StoSoilB20]|uniref:hypothetical protein n=1 Tax=Arthrobacter sp. StoSoilB20 TaxID=2830995 RepID=UPI001CC65416|nr:hypothetical protein [Arthrobacter sp. StoSoilB20]BCW57579.1 hypothetical protein StoSoilB20_09260 [Arthrobacter sp. StoSoilB20]